MEFVGDVRKKGQNGNIPKINLANIVGIIHSLLFPTHKILKVFRCPVKTVERFQTLRYTTGASIWTFYINTTKLHQHQQQITKCHLKTKG